MNPDNKALERTYFIGGAPRVGKSIVAYELARRIGGHVVSTDSIRNAAKKACPDRGSDLFIINRIENVSDHEWLEIRLERPGEVVDFQNRESIALWPSIVSFCNTFSEDSAAHIIEGVALLPSLVAGMKSRPKHIMYIGNTSYGHLDSMLQYAEKFPQQDWMMALGYSREKFEGMAKFVQEMSRYFKFEAKKYGFPYFDMDDRDFEGSTEMVLKELIKQI